MGVENGVVQFLVLVAGETECAALHDPPPLRARLDHATTHPHPAVASGPHVHNLNVQS